MQSDRPVIEITSPPEAPLPGSSMIGAVLFPAFALIGLALGLIYSMPWLVTSSLAISLALLAAYPAWGTLATALKVWIMRENRSG